MRKLTALILACVATLAAWAQTPFQGTLNYSWKFMGEGVEQFEAMMPTGSVLKVRGKDSRFEMEGGMLSAMMGDILAIGKKGEAYMLKDDESTAYKMKKDDKEEGEEIAPVITKEDEVIQIAGYDCQKYSVTTSADGMEITQYVWVNEKFTMPEAGGGGMLGATSVKGVKGLPMKIMVNQGPMTMVMTVTSVDLTLPEKALFKVPKGYKIEDFDPAMFGGMGM
jgi:Domain of unknown function (DUF4412)